jgi:predicted PurR-regulated permease PerM
VAIRSSNKDIFNLFSVVVAVVLVCALYFAKAAFIPLALAILFAFVLTPVVGVLERARLGRTPATSVVILVVLACIGAVGWIIAKQFTQVINQLPLYQSNIEQKIDSLHLSKNSTLENASATIKEINRALASSREPNGDSREGKPGEKGGAVAAKLVPVQIIRPPTLPLDSLQNALGLLLQVLIVIVFTSLMLVHRENLRNRFISLVGQRQLSLMTHALDEASERVSRYLRMQLIINAIYGTVIGIGLHFIGIPGALLWGVIVGVLRFLPYVGPPLGGIMPVLLAFALFPGWKMALITMAMFVTAEVIVSHAVEPMLYGAHTGISPLAILIAAIFWTILWGPVGLVLSTPLTVCIVVLGRYVPHLSFVPVLLGGNPDLQDDALVYQRLLAADQEEAEEILEGVVEKKSLLDAYDSVLLPALNLAKQDRNRGQIDDHTARFVFQSCRDIIDELYERGNDSAQNAVSGTEVENYPLPKTALPAKIVCIPARDEADQLAGIMLAQLLEDARHRALCIPHTPVAEAIEQVKLHDADIVCISALPPFVISHSRTLFRAVKTHSARIPVVVGVWTFAGDTSKLSKRIGTGDDVAIATTLAQAVREIVGLQESGVDHDVVPQQHASEWTNQ